MCHPFGYLKASSSLTTVNLFVMPYNYPVLLPLLGKNIVRNCGLYYFGLLHVVYMKELWLRFVLVYQWHIFVTSLYVYLQVVNYWKLKAFQDEDIDQICIHSCINKMIYNFGLLLKLKKLHFYLFHIAEELFKAHNLKPNQQWRQRFESYLKTMPGYYAPVSFNTKIKLTHLYLYSCN